MILLVNGHTHANTITPHPRPADSPIDGGFWEVNSASHIDWPIQSRIIEIAAGALHRGSRTISIFTTMVDIDGPVQPAGVAPDQLAAWGRELALNDPTERPKTRIGAPEDRNTELMVPAPFVIRRRCTPGRAPRSPRSPASTRSPSPTTTGP